MPDSSAPADQPDDNPYTALILHDGDTVRAGTGWVIAAPDEPVRFCAPEPMAGVSGAQPGCHTSVDVTGVDLDRLTHREVRDGVVYGFAQLTGTYRGSSIAVTRQSPPVEGTPTVPGDPPCPAPHGGWPPPTPGNDGNLDDRPVEAYRHEHPGTIVTLALSRPAANQVVMLVLTSGPTEPVRAALAADYPDQLCVIHSDFTHDDVRAARHALMIDSPDGAAAGAWSIGTAMTKRGQLEVDVEMRQVTDAVAADAAAQTPGLVRLIPWLTPVH